jgi:hypothetical protein
MPEIRTYVDVDIDVDDFMSDCNRREIKEVIDYLIDEGHINESIMMTPESKMGIMEREFIENMSKLSGCYYRLKPEEEKILENLFKKYN